MSETYDLIVVGSSFASTFFLHRYLARAPSTARVLVLERGSKHGHGDLLRERWALRKAGNRTFVRKDSKNWWYAPAFGGTSNMWYGNTPRMFEEDFALRSTHGVGVDWPIGYDDLEESYCDAEEMMGVSGPERSPVPRSRPYPQRAHQLSDPEKLLAQAHPEHFFPIATARATQQAPGGRGICCANYKCNFCPVDAKFTIANTLASTYADPRVTLLLGATVQAVNVQGTAARGVMYLADGREVEARGDLVALGANALFNPHILLRSGLEGPAVGRYLHEQVGFSAYIDLDGIDSYQGSTACTGHHHLFSTGAHRAERAGFLLETYSDPVIRMKPGRYRQRIRVAGVFEDLPNAESRVTLDPADPTRPRTRYAGHSDYAERGLKRFMKDLQTCFVGVPVERFIARHRRRTEGHILGTARMGLEPSDSVVDAGLRHHTVRNLLVLGGSAFPTGAAANPSLTIAALSLYAAERLN